MLLNDPSYLKIVEQIKGEIAKAQYKATLSVNRELILLYYNIGKVINENKTWGNKFIDNLAKDIKLSYPNSTGYSVRNLKYMAKFAETYPDGQIVQEVLAQLTWYHNTTLPNDRSASLFSRIAVFRRVFSFHRQSPERFAKGLGGKLDFAGALFL